MVQGLVQVRRGDDVVDADPNETTVVEVETGDELDFMLSRAGQEIVAGESQLYSIHPEVTGPTTAAALRASEGGSLRPIRVGPGLLVYLDQVKRRKFLKQWQRALAGH